jgi:hypothetical protein
MKSITGKVPSVDGVLQYVSREQVHKRFQNLKSILKIKSVLSSID